MELESPLLDGHAHGRVPRDIRRRQIVQLAGELFAERGYQGTSMSELARRAGISKPVIYDLIGSKEDVYRASCEEVVGEYAETIAAAVADEHHEPAAQLRASVVAALELADKHERAAAVLFSSESGQFAAAVDWIRHQRGALIAQLLGAQALALGRTVDPVQLEAVGHALGGAFEALALWRSEHKSVPVSTVADWFVGLTLTGVERLGAETGAN